MSVGRVWTEIAQPTLGQANHLKEKDQKVDHKA